jgi:hypothetical protein
MRQSWGKYKYEEIISKRSVWRLCLQVEILGLLCPTIQKEAAVEYQHGQRPETQ